MNEKDKQKLIAHIKEESQKALSAKTDEFEDALFESKVRLFLTMEANK